MPASTAYRPAEHRLASALNLLALLLAALAVLALVAPWLWPGTRLVVAPPFFWSNSIAGLALAAFLAWLSAADVRRYRPAIRVLIIGLLAGALSAVIFALTPLATGFETALLAAFGLCSLAGLALAALLRAAETSAPPWLPWIPDTPPAAWERAAAIIFALFGAASLGAVALTLALAVFGPGAAAGLFVQPLALVGSNVKIALLGLCALLIAWDVRRFTHATQLLTALVVGNVASIVAITLLALGGLERFGNYDLPLGPILLTRDTLMLAAWLLDAVVIAGFLSLNSRLNQPLVEFLGFLSATQFRALEAIAEALIAGGPDEMEEVPPHQVALRTDNYLRSFRSNRLRLARMAAMGLQLSPLVWFKPPVTYLNPDARRRFIDGRFKQGVITPPPAYRALDRLVEAVNRLILRLRRLPETDANAALSFTGLIEAMLRFNMQLTYLGFYSDPAVWPKTASGGIGYTPFSKRPKDFDITPLRPHPPLQVLTPEGIAREGIDTIDDADVVIIGSGAAGAILAEQLAERGRSVLILEKGLYVPPDDFNEDEIDMISRLYSDGALQISQSLRFTILQGSCVGGTTVVNNAVCFDTPRSVLDAWNARGPQPVIDVERFYAAQAAVKRRLSIGRIAAGTRRPLDGGVLNHGDERITRGVQRYFEGRPDACEYDVVSANIHDCLGCGYCNIGCKYGRKLSMLDEVLPAAQAQYGPEAFRILSETEVVRLEHDGGHVKQVTARVGGARTLCIRNPKAVVLSAGTVASSWLMLQSGIGAGALPVGKGLSFNMGSPLHGWFNSDLNSYDGLQIAHYLKVRDHPGFVYETWYNPPVAQALAMPGWLDTHFHNMRRYNQMAAVGVLVGTKPNAYLTRALVTGGPDVVYQPHPDDLKSLVDALIILGEIMFAGGAVEVYASTRRYHHYTQEGAVFSAQSALDELRTVVQRDQDILLGTGHPQGGNALGVSPANSVVGPDFKVFGYDNLYACDASVFPSATTVNPQLTVMGLAHYAAPLVDAG